jgi:Mg-chelatase subunit ChlD
MSNLRRAAAWISKLASLPAFSLVLASTFAGSAAAEVELRVEARPADQPIQAFVTVKNGCVPMPCVAADFTIRIDGQVIGIQGGDVTLPPSQDPNQKLSVVFVMDYSQSIVAGFRVEMESSVIAFIGEMNDGDNAAVVKFNDTNPLRASVVAPFTPIDAVAGNQALIAAVQSDYEGDGTNLLDALEVAVNHVLNPPAALPAGPKAIILISDGHDNRSEIEASDVFQLASENSIPIFTIGIGEELSLPGAEQLMMDLASETGGDYLPAPTALEIADAYVSISSRLNNEYLISVVNGITDCAQHIFEVTVMGETVSAPFTRRVCDTTPDPFSFTAQTNVQPDSDVTSNSATITGVEVPAHISIIGGRYSIGCTATFTTDPATINNGQSVCIRHHTSTVFSDSETSTLTIGGVAATFTSTTRADSGGGGSRGGGGGATGLLELLLGFGVLLLGRRRAA